MHSLFKQKNKIIISFCLVLVTGAIYGVAVTYDFVDYDDQAYVTDNHHVATGFSIGGVVWAFTSTLQDHWHPVTMLSHMLDCQLFGLNPAGHHLTNILLHILNTILLFVLLERTTKVLWPSALVAAFFALHPLHVESVAWIAARKDLLSTFFMLMTLWVYVLYTEHSGLGTYVLSLILFTLGLMSKSMVVTLPLLLLLLDFWPLGRLNLFVSDKKGDGPSSPIPTHKVLWEKAPFFLLSIIISIVTLLARQDRLTGTARPFIPFAERFIHAMNGYAFYIWKMFLPTNLSIAYELGDSVFKWQPVLSVVLIAGISSLCLMNIKKRPYLIFGWLWYLVILAPVSGIIEAGPLILADRYTYTPLIGLFIMFFWGGLEICGKMLSKRIAAAAMIIILVICSIFCFRQVGCWRDSITLYSRSLIVNQNSAFAELNLGLGFHAAGDEERAMVHLNKAIQLAPRNPRVQYGIGYVFFDKGEYQKAIGPFSETIKAQPNHGPASLQLAICLARTGSFDIAQEYFVKAIDLMPNNPDAYFNYGYALSIENRTGEALDQMKKALDVAPNNELARQKFDILKGIKFYEDGKIQEAVEQLNEVVQRFPEEPQAHLYLGLIALSRRQTDSAISHFSNAIGAEPQYTEAHVNLGIALIWKKEYARAEKALFEALTIEPNHVKAHYNYAASLYLQHRNKEAIEELAKTLEIAPDYKKARELLNTIRKTNTQ